jgi:hypothetical protein
MHGAVAHIVLDDHKLYAATILGVHLVWDLKAFETDYCELLNQVWSKVPVVWEGGTPVVMPPPDDHRCLAKARNNR